LPHLEGGIIDEQERAVAKLGELVDEMARRYRVLKENKVANIFDLNAEPDATERLPLLWIIHDEFAEWMMTEDYAEAVAISWAGLG
jgi:DNA segregation ATPase FtsK/SpoIIIE, S-DNA-T family